VTLPSPAQASPAGLLWRVGRYPRPWAWVPWEFSGGNRWDDVERTFRTAYAAESAFACFVELLATYRPDPRLVADMAAIHVDHFDAVTHPTSSAGQVPLSWLNAHVVSSAVVTGVFCDVTAAATIAALRPQFLPLTRSLGMADFDAAALKSARPRELTQRVASHIYQLAYDGADELFTGVRFASRHGDELALWAIFERPGDEPWSNHISIQSEDMILSAGGDLQRARELHGLRW
jgi:RES domain